VGDFHGNAARIMAAYDAAVTEGAALVVFPECALVGYNAEDLLLRPAFAKAAMQAAEKLAVHTAGKQTALLTGGIWREGDTLHNVALWMEDGRITHMQRKHELPNEGVFDERRIFQAGALPDVISWRGHRIGVMICADLWHRRIAAHLSAQGMDVCLILNASPYEHGKDAKRKALVREVALASHIPVAYLNMTGGQDEVVFDGGSFVMDAHGHVVQQLPYFEEAQATCLFQHDNVGHEVPSPYPSPASGRGKLPLRVSESTAGEGNTGFSSSTHAWDYAALCMGLRDYVQKNSFQRVVLGLSGGIDSALTACIAVDALGAENVHCVMLPSPYTADISLQDAQKLAETLGVRYDVLPIAEAMQAVENTLSPLAPTVPTPLAQENIQSRLRAVLLMAISNSMGALLITTGNKSELAVGYATLYGDMCGAYNPLKDVYKTEVYALAQWRNTHSEIIPERILTRAPSAELRDNQTDQDSLPPYDTLDGILRLLIEGRASAADCAAAGYAQETVTRVVTLLTRTEYKRSQAPIGTKITSLAFGKDWRMPLTHRYNV
jgi:NAD+ synthetase